jgi:hypothetical protein
MSALEDQSRLHRDWLDQETLLPGRMLVEMRAIYAGRTPATAAGKVLWDQFHKEPLKFLAHLERLEDKYKDHLARVRPQRQEQEKLEMDDPSRRVLSAVKELLEEYGESGAEHGAES